MGPRRRKNHPPSLKTLLYHASPHHPTLTSISNSCAVCRRLPTHHQYSKSQPLSVGIFFACSPSENRNHVARVASAAARFPARFPQIHLSVISRDASARDATSSIFNDLQAAGSTSNLVGRWGIEKGLARYARIQAGSCGLRRRPWRRYSAPFSLSVGQFSPFLRPVKPAKSSSTKYNTALNQ